MVTQAIKLQTSQITQTQQLETVREDASRTITSLASIHGWYNAVHIFDDRHFMTTKEGFSWLRANLMSDTKISFLELVLASCVVNTSTLTLLN